MTHAATTSPSERPLEGRTILIADDQPVLLDMFEDALIAAGARVHRAENGERALEIVRRERLDAVVSDMRMPRMNGHELMRAVRASLSPSARSVVAIAVSGADSWKYLNPLHAAGAGYDLHLAKPVMPQLLIAELARLLRGRPRAASGTMPRVRAR